MVKESLLYNLQQFTFFLVFLTHFYSWKKLSFFFVIDDDYYEDDDDEDDPDALKDPIYQIDLQVNVVNVWFYFVLDLTINGSIGILLSVQFEFSKMSWCVKVSK